MKKIIQLLSCIVTISACTQVPAEPKISDKVRLIPDDLAATVLVEDTRIMVPAQYRSKWEHLRADNIIVSSYGNGFLRRVVSVVEAAGGLILETVDAAITDAVINGDLVVSETTEVAYDFSGASLEYGNTKVAITSGNVNFRPKIRLEIRIRDAKIEKFDVSGEGVLRATPFKVWK